MEELLEELGVDVNNGFGDLINKIKQLPSDKKSEIETTIKTCFR